MAAELVATQAAIPEGYILMPVQHIAGLPWYIWGFTVLGFALFMVLGGFVLYWWMMGPCRDYFSSQLHNDDMLLFMQKSGKLSFKRADYVTKIFAAIDLPLSWIQRSDESFRFGKCMTKLVTDVNGVCTEPTINQAIKTYVYEWNETELNREAYAAAQQLQYVPDLILDYKGLYEKVKSGQIDDPVVIPSVFEVPAWEIERYLMPVGAGDLDGHIKTRVAEETEKADTEAWPNWMKAFVAIEIGLVIVAVIAFMLKGS